MLRYYQSLVFLFAPRLVLGSVPGTRAVAAPAGPFGLYAYGGGIGGAQVFYSNGKLEPELRKSALRRTRPMLTEYYDVKMSPLSATRRR